MIAALFKKDRPGFSVLGAVWIFVFLILAGNVFFEDGSLFYVGSNTVTLFGKYLCYALLAVSLDLIWGYLGIVAKLFEFFKASNYVCVIPIRFYSFNVNCLIFFIRNFD